MGPWGIFAGLNGAVAVALGAYAAHGLGGGFPWFDLLVLIGDDA